MLLSVLLVALGGWIVTFMIRVRKGAPFPSGISAVGFWLGITVGRVILGFVTGKIGEKLAITVSPSLTKRYESTTLETRLTPDRSTSSSPWV